MIRIQKEDFLKRTGVNSRASAMCNAIQASLQRNLTYLPNAHPEARQYFRAEFATAIDSQARRYQFGIAEHEHMAVIEEITKKMSQNHASILQNNCLRIGTTQKALNLYLKFLWCLESDWRTPPHCPVDGTVLKAGGILGTWTQLNSLEQYLSWISLLRSFAAKKGFASLAEWELSIWNNQAPTRPLRPQNFPSRKDVGIPIRILAKVRGRGYKTDGLESLSIDVERRTDAAGLPFQDGARTPIDLQIGDDSYRGGIRTIPMQTVYICPDLIDKSGKKTTLAKVLAAHRVGKNQTLTLETDGNRIRLLPEPTL